MTDRESAPDPAEVLGALVDHGEFEIDPSRPDAEVASDCVSVDTPAGWLAFEVLPVEDYGAEHERHDPDEDVYVNTWFLEGYTVVHVQTGVGTDATHTLDVHEQRPRERAMELQAHGVPERRAEIAALREEGLTYSEIVDATGPGGPNHRGDVSTHLQKYDQQVWNARWLAENARPLGAGRGAADPEDDDD